MERFKIREARKAAKMTQEDLAQLLGINRATLSRYESGAIDPPSSQLQAIAAALGVPLEQLVGIPGSAWGKAEQQIRDTSSPSILGEPLPADVQRVASSMEQMNEEGRGKVVDYAEDLEASGRYKKRGAAGMGKEA